MSGRALNRRFFLLQAILILIDCITVAYISPILVSLGYSNGQIGLVMTLGALASTLARPLWGILNDRFSCARQVTLAGTAVGLGCYFLLTWGGGSMAESTGAVMGLYVSVVCMMNFVDSWALRLMSAGAPLDYGATRAGGSVSYAFGAMLFGLVVSRWGFRPGNWILWVLWALLWAVVLGLPNPPAAAPARHVSLGRGLAALAPNRLYWIMLAAFFLATLTSSSMESFYSVLILSLGGTERHVGLALFLQAISELPVMLCYTRLRRRLRWTPAALMGVAMACYGLKALTLGQVSSLGPVMAAALFQALSFALFTPASVDFMLSTVPEEYLATAHLLFLAAGQGAGAVAGNALSGALAERWGVGPMFQAVSLTAFAAAGLALYCGKTIRRRALS